MSDFEDTTFHANGSESNNSSNSTTGSAPKVKPVKVGMLELGLFFGVWVVLIVAYKMYSRYQERKSIDRSSL